MALIPEDGTGRADADSLVSLAEANAYFAAHGSPAAWSSATDAAKEAALRYATRWVAGRGPWRGVIAVTTQALPWPRAGAIDPEGRTVPSNVVPEAVKEAVCERALAHLSTSISAAADVGIEALKLGDLSIEFAGSAGASQSFPLIEALLLPYLAAGAGGGSVRSIRG